MEICHHMFASGDLLILNKTKTEFVGYKECEVFHLFYAQEEEVDSYSVYHSEYFKLADLALEAFNTRLNSADPFKESGLAPMIDTVFEEE